MASSVAGCQKRRWYLLTYAEVSYIHNAIKQAKPVADSESPPPYWRHDFLRVDEHLSLLSLNIGWWSDWLAVVVLLDLCSTTRSLPRTRCAMRHMGLGPLVLSATAPRAYATYAASCSASNLESVFDLHYAELNETMGLAQGKHFRQQPPVWLLAFSNRNTTEVSGEGILSGPFGSRGSAWTLLGSLQHSQTPLSWWGGAPSLRIPTLGPWDLTSAPAPSKLTSWIRAWAKQTH